MPTAAGQGDLNSRVVLNSRPGVDWNRCGQAAVATVLAHFGAGPFADGASPSHGAAIDVVAATHPPDMPFGLGTTAWRLASALRAHGVGARIVHSGAFGRHAGRSLEVIRRAIARGVPVPVCVDNGLLGGHPWVAHWAVALAIEDDAIRLGNARPACLSITEFLRAWRCRQLPLTHHHCAVVPEG